MIYVDDMRAPFGRMLMCHMIADTTAELDETAWKIGIARRYRQHSGTAHEHYDICLKMRGRAIALGAREITWKQCAMMCANRHANGALGDPEGAEAIWRAAYQHNASLLEDRRAAEPAHG